MEGEAHKNLHLQGPDNLSSNTTLNQFELEIVEIALLRYGQSLSKDNFREKEAVAFALRKINLARSKACCNVIELMPM